MEYSDERILQQLTLAEDSIWEFKQVEFAGNKPKKPSRSAWADEIAAFANADGGVLLCGISDEGEIQDLSREQLVSLDNLLTEVSTDSIEPAVRIRTQHREPTPGGRVLLLEVPKGDPYHKSPGGSFVRVGASKRKMSSDECLRLAQRRSQARYLWFDKQPVPETGLKTLDETLWRSLISAEGAANPGVALEKLALLVNDEDGFLRATVAGILFCTQTPEKWLSGASIMATRYEGNDRFSRQIDAQEISGPLHRQVAESMKFATRNMSVAARKVPERIDIPQYSDRALFEALVNAVVHRDYSLRMRRIHLAMFENRVEIQSPGSLANDLTLASLGERQATRNEALTSVFVRLPVSDIRGSGKRHYFMERRGDGVQIIQSETHELCGEFPEYRLIDGSELRLTIPASVQEQSAANVFVSTWCEGKPLQGIDLLVLFPNKTWKQARTDESGGASIDLYTTHLPLTVFAAAQGYEAKVQREWFPNAGALALELVRLPQGGSVVFSEATGRLPGMNGRLNAIRDRYDRMYLYASNIAINDGQQQPVNFFLGETLKLTDSNGNSSWVRIIEVLGRSALVEYRSEQ